jgi:RNA polymerase sigma-70 factor (ECF subfamily)
MADGDLESYQSALLLIARAQLARQQLDGVDASDLVQQTMLEAHRDWDQFKGQTEAERFAWLRKALYHNFLDACARARAGKVQEADLTQSFIGLDELLIAPDTSPSERAVRSEDLTRLAKALDRLEERQRQAVLLKHIAGLTLKEISERLHCSPAAVAGLLYRGRQHLQELLERGAHGRD